MSPAAQRRYRVAITAARQLTRDLEAPNATSAMMIAEYLYATFGDSFFTRRPEEIFNIDAKDMGETAS
jgi:hypothetical protein